MYNVIHPQTRHTPRRDTPYKFKLLISFCMGCLAWGWINSSAKCFVLWYCNITGGLTVAKIMVQLSRHEIMTMTDLGEIFGHA